MTFILFHLNHKKTRLNWIYDLKKKLVHESLIFSTFLQHFCIKIYKTQNMVHPMPSDYSGNINILWSLLSVRTSSPLSCSLLMYRLSVQKRKACLLRWRVSKKGRQPVRCPSLPVLQSSRQNNRSLSPWSVCSPSRPAPPTRVPRTVQINGIVDSHCPFGKVMGNGVAGK